MADQGWADTVLKVGSPLALLTAFLGWISRLFESREKLNAQAIDAQGKRENAQADRNDRENERIIADLRRDREDRDRIIKEINGRLNDGQTTVDHLRERIDHLIRERDYYIRIGQWQALVALGARLSVRKIIHDANNQASLLLGTLERSKIALPQIKAFDPLPDDEALAERLKPKAPEGVQEAV